MSLSRFSVEPSLLAEWCCKHLGSEPKMELFRAEHLSSVVGLRLLDRRQVVVKVRPSSARVVACVEVQKRMFAAGYPCPEPLAGPAPLGVLLATAEAFAAGGLPSQAGGATAGASAAAFADLIALAPRPSHVGALGPSPSWAAWDHAGPGLWPATDDLDMDLNAVDGPAWLDEAAFRARGRLRQGTGKPVIGHCDWISENVIWRGETLFVVHDWDSVISDDEEVLVGFAAALFVSDCSVSETDAFLRAYSSHRGAPLASAAVERAWAAGVWTRAVDAKYQYATGGAVVSLTEEEARERLHKAGLAGGYD